MTHIATRECSCQREVPMGAKRPPKCEHGNRFLTRSQLEPKRRGSTLKQGKGFAASKDQRRKVRGKPCVNCSRSQAFDIGDGGGVFAVDPAHLLPRGQGGCDAADCVVPLCRTCHRLFDEGQLELLPKLVDKGYWEEMAHMISAHQVSPSLVVRRLTVDQVAA